MRYPTSSAFALACLLLAACARGEPPPQAEDSAGAGMEFSGVRGCSDCDAILSWLRLEAAGRSQRYRLVERYRTASGERRFEESGTWRAQGDRLHLLRTGGGERVYARLPDGRLQGRDGAGQPDPRLEDDLLAPLSFDQSR